MHSKLFAYRKIDDTGRVVIPQEMRKRLGIEAEQWLLLYAEGDRLILRPTDENEDKQKVFLR